jgi:hypothetical protein
MDQQDIRQALREQRLTTLALADQIKEDRWREPALPGDRTIHDILAHLIGWDEWAVAAFEISASRPLPLVLIEAYQHVDAYNERIVKRYHNLTRDDVISALQGSDERVVASAMATSGSGDWLMRELPDLAVEGQKRMPTVRRVLRILLHHEREHDEEISAAFGIEPHLEQFQERAESGE